jgi:hypothetical protein
MIRMKTLRIGHDQEIEIGPPLLKPAPKLVKQPARMEMIENEMAKLENPDHERFRSCLYPSFASSFSSSVRFRAASDMGTPVLRGAFFGRLDPLSSGRLRLATKRFELRPLT